MGVCGCSGCLDDGVEGGGRRSLIFFFWIGCIIA